MSIFRRLVYRFPLISGSTGSPQLANLILYFCLYLFPSLSLPLSRSMCVRRRWYQIRHFWLKIILTRSCCGWYVSNQIFQLRIVFSRFEVQFLKCKTFQMKQDEVNSNIELQTFDENLLQIKRQSLLLLAQLLQ